MKSTEEALLNVNIPIFLMEKNLNVTYQNHAAEEMLSSKLSLEQLREKIAYVLEESLQFITIWVGAELWSINVSKLPVDELLLIQIEKRIEEHETSTMILNKISSVDEVFMRSLEGMYYQIIEKDYTRVLLANPAFLQQMGYTEEEFRRLDVQDMLAKEEEQESQRVMELLRDEGEMDKPLWKFQTKDGRHIILETVVSNVSTEHYPNLYLVCCRDVTENQRVLAQLQETNHIMSTLIHKLQLGVLVTEDDRVKISNENWSDMFELTETIEPGTTIEHLVHSLQENVNPTISIAQMYDTLVESQQHRRNLRLRFKDNRVIAIDYIPIRKNDGAVDSLWISKDLTDDIRKEEKITEAHRLQSALINAMQEGIFLITDGQIKLVSKNVANIPDMKVFPKLDGITWQELATIFATNFINGKQLAKQFYEMKTSRKMTTNIEVQSISGFTYEVDFIPLDGLAPNTHMWVIRDLTHKKLTEQRLIQARQKAIEADRSKAYFLSQISHDLRTPLNSIVGYSQILLEMVGEENTKANRMLDKIHQAGNDMSILIKDSLDFASIQSGTIDINFSFVSVNKVMAESMKLVQYEAEGKNIRLVVETETDGLFILADPVRVKQIMVNILSNAVKYSYPSSVVTISAQKQDGKVVFQVQDEGIGMSEAQIQKIFTPFYRTKQSMTMSSGSGIGLSIVHELVEKQGGNIHVQSSVGAGSTFTVRFPLVEVTPNTKREESDTSSYSCYALQQEKSVLYIEDNNENIELVKTMLESCSTIDFHYEMTGKDGITYLENHKPDVLLLDIRLPDMNGLDILHYVKRDERLRDIPVIILSANNEKQFEQLAIDHGASDYFSKPFNIQDVKNTLVKRLFVS